MNISSFSHAMPSLPSFSCHISSWREITIPSLSAQQTKIIYVALGIVSAISIIFALVLRSVARGSKRSYGGVEEE